mgnify:CR=1 FL=1
MSSYVYHLNLVIVQLLYLLIYVFYRAEFEHHVTARDLITLQEPLEGMSQIAVYNLRKHVNYMHVNSLKGLYYIHCKNDEEAKKPIIFHEDHVHNQRNHVQN